MLVGGKGKSKVSQAGRPYDLRSFTDTKKRNNMVHALMMAFSYCYLCTNRGPVALAVSKHYFLSRASCLSQYLNSYSWHFIAI